MNKAEKLDRIAAFNVLFPVGTKVYLKEDGKERLTRTEIAGAAFLNKSEEMVAWFQGISGSYKISCCKGEIDQGIERELLIEKMANKQVVASLKYEIHQTHLCHARTRRNLADIEIKIAEIRNRAAEARSQAQPLEAICDSNLEIRDKILEGINFVMTGKRDVS